LQCGFAQISQVVALSLGPDSQPNDRHPVVSVVEISPFRAASSRGASRNLSLERSSQTFCAEFPSVVA
jgi:hypothetical protein